MPGSSPFTIVIIGALILFVLFRRARALITRQKIRPNTMALRLGIFAVLGLAILILTLSNAPSLIGDLVGLAIGAAVGWWGLRLTTFERQPDGVYYTPNKYIGLGVFALFLLRLLYRLATEVGSAGTLTRPTGPGAAANVLAQFTSDPLTTTVYFLLIGYYAFYYAMLILRARQPATVP